MMDLSGRVALVTGGAGGIGRATVRAFHDAGAAVAFCDIDDAAGRACADGLGLAEERVLFVCADVGDRTSVDAFVATAVERFGRVDVLVNNAGITHDRTEFGALSFDVWNRVLNINLNGTFFATQAALPHMLRQGGGAIINVGSILAEAALPGKVAYVTSKAAIAGFSKALALDLAGHAIRVNCLVPGSVDTAMMWRGLSDASKRAAEEQSREDIPLGRVGSPDELASVIVFLASHDARYITGASLLVDGGLLARISAKQ